MKKITLVSAVAAAAFAATAAFSATNVFAADGDQTTTAHIGLTTKNDDGSDQAITIDAAPGIEFGSQPISASGATYTATGFTDKGDTLQVTNPGFDSGWTVYASASDFTTTPDADGKTKTLKGAVLSLAAGEVAAPNAHSDAATPTAITFNNKGQAVLSATDGTQGVGINKDTFTAKKATLDVPAGNTEGDYTANLTWTLTNAPTGENN